MKKLFKILLVLLLSMGIFTSNSVNVHAEESGTYDNVDWRITDSGELIIGKEGETQTFTYRGDRYLNSYPWYSKWNSISSVHFAGVVKGNGDMSGMFRDSQATSLDLSSFDTSSVTNMGGMFRDSQAASLDLSSFNTANVTNMAGMFCGSKATSINLSSFNTSNVRDMSDMFRNSKATSLDLSSFDTSNVTDMFQMFSGSQAASLDLSSFNTSKVTNMYGMFSDSKATSINLSSFDTSNVTNMNGMFWKSQATSINLSSFDTSKVTDMNYMFSGFQATHIRFSNNMLGDNGERFKNTRLSGSDWVKVRDKSGNLTYNDTQFSGEQVRNLNESTTPALSGTWVKKSSPEYQSEIDKGQEYISKQGINANNEWVKNGNTWTYTFDVFDDSIPYYIWEDRIPGYTSSVMKPNKDLMNQNGEKYYEIINRSTDTGSIKISKQTNDTSDKKFEFTIRLTGNNLDGTKIFSGVIFEDGVGKVILGKGESKTIEGLPIGTSYTVEEKEYADYIVTSSNTSGVITKGNTSEVTFNNDLIPPKPEGMHSLSIKKSIIGSSDRETPYEFMIYFDNLGENKTILTSRNESLTASDNGSLYHKFELKGDETLSFIDVPLGATYQITESAGEYISSYEIRDINQTNQIVNTSNENTSSNTALSTQIETVDEGESIIVNFSNKIIKKQDIKIKKEVIGTNEDKNKNFDITIELYGLTPRQGIETDLGKITADEDGYAIKTIQLKHGEEFIIPEIPIGTQYQIREEKNNCFSSYELIDDSKQYIVEKQYDTNKTTNTTLSTKLETIDEDEEITVQFTNKSAVSLNLEKIVDGNMGNKTDAFDFTVRITDWETLYAGYVNGFSMYNNHKYGTLSDYPIENVDVLLNPSNEDEWVARTYVDNTLYGTWASNENYTGMLGASWRDVNGNIQLTVTNSDSPYQIASVPDNIDIGTRILEEMKYSIDLSKYGGTDNGDGTYTFKLNHADKIEFSNIPYGAEFEIIEDDYSSLGYRTYINNSLFQKRQISDTLFADKDVIFSNINGATVPTGIRLLGSGTLLVAISTLLFIYLRKKKRVVN